MSSAAVPIATMQTSTATAATRCCRVCPNQRDTRRLPDAGRATSGRIALSFRREVAQAVPESP